MAQDQTDDPARAAPVRLAFRVAYLGSRFYGSQLQAAQRTVEGEFIAACQRLGLFSDWRRAGFLSAGRTDRGVHAYGQVVAFSTSSPNRAAMAINAQLPPDCWCTGVSCVPDQFNPRYDAVSRTYRYYFPGVFPEQESMQRAARAFLGEHNFTSFARVKGKNPWRRILAIAVDTHEGMTCIEVRAESFLWHQVRCMASALAAVGSGDEEESFIGDLLGAAAERPLQPAPAEGLILWETDCGLCWQPLAAGERSTEFLDHLNRHHLLMGRICTTLLSAHPER